MRRRGAGLARISTQKSRPVTLPVCSPHRPGRRPDSGSVCLMISFSVEVAMGTGGQRFGAGRPAKHGKAEHYQRIDSREMQRHGALTAGRAGDWQWIKAGATGGFSFECVDGGETLVLRYCVNGSPVNQRVPILKTACNYGGERAWFACPGCWNRVAVLFVRGAAGFCCRQCAALKYASQSDCAMSRAWRVQRKVEARLKSHHDKPKGMHQATHTRLLAVIAECERRRNVALFGFVQHFMGGRYAR